MLVGVLIGKPPPPFVDVLRRLGFGSGSRIDFPIAVQIWLMIIPMKMRADFTAMRRVGKRARGRAIKLFVNWLVKPFSMALFAWLFLRVVFPPGLLPIRLISTLRVPSSCPLRRTSPRSVSGAISPTAIRPARGFRSRSMT
jgi:ACR3 family arsenite efflux pump ArsB